MIDAGALRYFGRRTTVDLIGLNDHRMMELDKTHGAAPLMGLGLDYVVVPPKPYAAPISQLPLRELYSVRSPYYTICDAPQDVLTVYRMEPPVASARPSPNP